MNPPPSAARTESVNHASWTLWARSPSPPNSDTQVQVSHVWSLHCQIQIHRYSCHMSGLCTAKFRYTGTGVKCLVSSLPDSDTQVYVSPFWTLHCQIQIYRYRCHLSGLFAAKLRYAGIIVTYLVSSLPSSDTQV